MSQDIYVTITRKGTTIASNVLVQLDVMNPHLGKDYDGNHPFDFFEAYIYYLPSTTTVIRGDEFTDTINTSPSTGSLTQYLVIGRPEPFPDGHVECVVNQYVGSNT
jgi:hypothetical protein